MALSKGELRKLERKCRKLPPGKDWRCKDYVTNLMLTALDFQLRVKVVNEIIKAFQNQFGKQSHRWLKAQIGKFPNTKAGNKLLARHLWRKNLWTRAKFLRVIVNRFDQLGITDQKSLRAWLKGADFERDIRGKFKSKDHSMGIAIFHWLCLRSGIDTVKPDLHVLNFVTEAIGRRAGPQETIEGLRVIAKKLRVKMYRLDSAIWQYQRNLH